MVNGELERDKKDRITGWEGIEKGPDVLETSDAEDDERCRRKIVRRILSISKRTLKN